MTMTGQSHEADLHRSTEAFNQGDVATAMKLFAPDVTFVVPGRSPLAGAYTGRDHVVQFFSRLHELSGGTFRIAVDDVVANERRVVLFLKVTARRGDDDLDVRIAGFQDDLGPDGWRRATFLPDDLAAFDRFFSAA